jgi:hypothetical protein
MKPFRDLTGQRIGRLKVRWPSGRSGNTPFWLCSCTCGKLKNIASSSLKRGDSRSCGCLRLEMQTSHGHASRGGKSAEYMIFLAAKQRCTNERNKRFKDYGGRGIQFRFTSFQEFLEIVGKRPSPELSLDRIDNNGNYEPGNVRWATHGQQRLNSRPKMEQTL